MKIENGYIRVLARMREETFMIASWYCLAFRRKDRQNHDNSESWWPVLQRRFEPKTFLIQVYQIIATPATYTVHLTTLYQLKWWIIFEWG